MDSQHTGAICTRGNQPQSALFLSYGTVYPLSLLSRHQAASQPANHRPSGDGPASPSHAPIPPRCLPLWPPPLCFLYVLSYRRVTLLSSSPTVFSVGTSSPRQSHDDRGLDDWPMPQCLRWLQAHGCSPLTLPWCWVCHSHNVASLLCKCATQTKRFGVISRTAASNSLVDKASRCLFADTSSLPSSLPSSSPACPPSSSLSTMSKS